MYIPPYKQLLESVKNKASAANSEDVVSIPIDVLKFIMQAALASCEFDENNYLRENPDVANGPVRDGTLTAKQHYVGYGYFEGRKGGMPVVDERWYEATYKDVAGAIKKGAAKSATDHFEDAGAIEGRAPSKRHLEIADAWKRLAG